MDFDLGDIGTLLKSLKPLEGMKSTDDGFMEKVKMAGVVNALVLMQKSDNKKMLNGKRLGGQIKVR